MSKSPAIRFAFAITQGDSAGLQCGHFRVWVHGDDTYIADVGLAGIWKTSLHGEVAWQTAETKESHLSTNPMLVPTGDRAPWKYDPPAFEDGRRLAFVIGVTRTAMRPGTAAPARYEVIEVSDRWDQLTKANVWMSVPPVAPDPHHIGPVLTLANETQVWVTRGEEPMDESTPEPPPDSTIAEPQIPGLHDVIAPGMIIRGINVAR